MRLIFVLALIASPVCAEDDYPLDLAFALEKTSRLCIDGDADCGLLAELTASLFACRLAEDPEICWHINAGLGESEVMDRIFAERTGKTLPSKSEEP